MNTYFERVQLNAFKMHRTLLLRKKKIATPVQGAAI
jgi:hypothetical protein